MIFTFTFTFYMSIGRIAPIWYARSTAIPQVQFGAAKVQLLDLTHTNTLTHSFQCPITTIQHLLIQ